MHHAPSDQLQRSTIPNSSTSTSILSGQGFYTLPKLFRNQQCSEMPDDPGDIATSEPVDDPEATALLSGEAAESSAAASVEDTGHRISAESPRQWAKRKRLELLDDLIRNLDILAYAEIATVYYLEYI